MYCGKTPAAEVGLASQPTLSCLENTVSWRALARMGAKMITAFCDSFARPPRQIVLDIDDTTDRTHGGQQLSLFNTHAGGYCFQPILIFEAATQKPVASILRPGKRPSGEEASSVVRHVVRQIRAHWPRVAITIRGDAHYGTPEVMDVLEDLDCLYIFGLSGNKRLGKIIAPWRDDVATRRALGGKEKVRRFFQTSYSAKSWRRDRRVIGRVEATTLGSDIRFIVTNIAGSKAKHLYEKVYCARGRMENLPFHRLKVNDCRVTDQGAQALSAIRPNLMPSLGGEPVPPVPAHRRLLAHASSTERRSQKVPMAQRHIRDHPKYLHQNCRSCRTDENAHPRHLPKGNTQHSRDQRHARKARRTGAVDRAASRRF